MVVTTVALPRRSSAAPASRDESFTGGKLEVDGLKLLMVKGECDDTQMRYMIMTNLFAGALWNLEILHSGIVVNSTALNCNYRVLLQQNPPRVQQRPLKQAKLKFLTTSTWQWWYSWSLSLIFRVTFGKINMSLKIGHLGSPNPDCTIYSWIPLLNGENPRLPTWWTP